MTTVKPITVLNIDSVPYAVNARTEEIQQLVETLDGWNQKEADAIDELNILQAAKQTLSAQIVAKIREESDKEAAAQVANELPRGDEEVTGVTAADEEAERDIE